ncbi:Ribosomal protein S24/S35 [Gracilaria domingensis]|nr:Ribosomal protein S24/S35 [Gracilaria domingensis]
MNKASRSATYFFERRCFATDGNRGTNGLGKEEEDSDVLIENDEFGMEGFEVIDETEDEADPVDQATSMEEDDITPELASDLVARMVEATTRRMTERTSASLLPVITPHTISCLRATRISTNKIRTSLPEPQTYPIEKKVTAEISIDSLSLSRPAAEALRLLSGPRLKEGLVRIGCNRFPSLEENRAHIVTQVDRLVAAAKTAVGESLDLTPLRSWDEIREEVEKTATEEIQEAGSVQLVLGEAKQ